MNLPPRAAALFDIDGTLLKTAGAGRRAFARALEEWIGRSFDDSSLDMGGRTDLEIFRDVLDALRIPYPPPPVRRQLVRRYLVFLEEELSDPAITTVLPGIEELLVHLDGSPDWTLGLVTGNVEPGAWLKLRAGGLERFFDFGAFGSDEEDRDRLVPVALRRFTRKSGFDLDSRSAIVIGDTVKDVSCARAAGAKIIAVETGFEDTRRLRASSPDAIFEDFAITSAVLEQMDRLVGLR